jgi:dienelactone hydrolase
VKTIVYPNGFHGFDDNRGRRVRWGNQTVVMHPDNRIRAQARDEVLATLRRAFGESRVK